MATNPEPLVAFVVTCEKCGFRSTYDHAPPDDEMCSIPVDADGNPWVAPDGPDLASLPRCGGELSTPLVDWSELATALGIDQFAAVSTLRERLRLGERVERAETTGWDSVAVKGEWGNVCTAAGLLGWLRGEQTP